MLLGALGEVKLRWKSVNWDVVRTTVADFKVRDRVFSTSTGSNGFSFCKLLAAFCCSSFHDWFDPFLMSLHVLVLQYNGFVTLREYGTRVFVQKESRMVKALPNQ